MGFSFPESPFRKALVSEQGIGLTSCAVRMLTHGADLDVDRPVDMRAEKDLHQFQEISRSMIKEKIGMIPGLADDMNLRILEAVDDVFTSLEPTSQTITRKRPLDGDGPTVERAKSTCPTRDQPNNVPAAQPAEDSRGGHQIEQVPVEDELSWLNNVDLDVFLQETMNDENVVFGDHELAAFLK